jgi:DNA-binding NtrC family response regulator
VGTVSCLARDGRLLHRRAEFIPLASGQPVILGLLAETDLSPQDLSAELAGEPSADELHRTIRRFRRAQVGHYALESLLGGSSAVRKVRSQIAAAAASGASVLILGRAGTGRAAVARAIHYRAAPDAAVRLVPVDCAVVSEDGLRRALDSVATPAGEPRLRPTLLLEHVERLAPAHQTALAEALRRGAIHARVIATTTDESESKELLPTLRDGLSTMQIQVPRLVDRLEDLPVLAQYFLEECNQGVQKQIGAIRGEALDQLALYGWPGELDQLREVIAAAHRSAASHEIATADLPPIIRHAAQAAALSPRGPQPIDLDQLLARIEREAIFRALQEANGNKSEAAELLGLSRPRLYRRLEQLGLAETSLPEKRRPAKPVAPPPAAAEEPLVPDFREVGADEAETEP